MKLNRGQEEAIRHGDGPCMVLAPPGSGKTLIITRRTQNLIENLHVKPENILVITFSRMAAREMRDRFHALTKEKKYKVTFGTFHSVFYGILKLTYGLTAESLLDEDEQYQILKDVLRNGGVRAYEAALSEEELCQELLREIGFVKNDLSRLADFKSKILPNESFSEVFRSYEQMKKMRKKLDFDDMLIQCYTLFKKHPEIIQKWQEKFQYILIDEFQDINRVQYEVIRMLAAPKYNLFVVGDDDQSIYGFRGSRPELMLYMKQELPNIRTIPLTVNYRSTENIVGAATKVILHNEERYYKRVRAKREDGEEVRIYELNNEDDEARFIAERVQKQIEQGVRPGDIGVLFRAASQARLLSEVFTEKQIPFEMREKIPNFYEHFIVKDLLAYMKLGLGDRDRGLFLRVANRPTRYIARQSLMHDAISFDDLKAYYRDDYKMRSILYQFSADLIMLKSMAPYAAVQFIRKKIGYDSFLQEYAQDHKENLEDLLQVVEEFEERVKPFATCEELEDHIRAYTEQLEKAKKAQKTTFDNRENSVQLMTMHSSKGLEFRQVYLIHANEGQTPYSKAKSVEELEEERRMFYVAMTRAKDALTITFLSTISGERAEASRFVYEIYGANNNRR